MSAQRLVLAVLASILSFACTTGSYTTTHSCRGGGGWYSKDKNLGPKNQSINYSKSYKLVRK